MPLKYSFVISDDDYKNLKESYNKNKGKLGDVSFDDYLQKTFDLAIKSHLQFSVMNDKMIDFFNEIIPPSKNDNNSNIDNLAKIDEFVNKLFEDKLKSNDHPTKKRETTNSTSNNTNPSNSNTNPRKKN